MTESLSALSARERWQRLIHDGGAASRDEHLEMLDSLIGLAARADPSAA